MNRIIILCALALALTGCADFNRQAQTATTRTVERVGIEQGQPTQLTETTTERTASESQAQAGVDVAKAMQAGFALLQGNITSLIDAAKPAPVDFGPVIAAISASNAGKPTGGGIDGTTGGIALTAVALGVQALRDHFKKKADAKDKEDLARDRDEGWRKAEEAHAREVELAKQLPSPVKT